MRKLLQISLIALLPFIYFAVMGSITNEKEISKSTGTFFKPVQVSYLPSFKDEFVNIIFNSGYQSWIPGIFLPNRLYEIKDVMNYSGAQCYFHQDQYYGNQMGTSINSIPGAENRMNQLMGGIQGEGLRGIYNRNRVADAIMYSQRVIYEVAPGNNQTSVNNGFVYNTMTGIYGTDSGRTVIRATNSPPHGIEATSPGYLCRDIYENMQHSDNVGLWSWTDRGTWHLKPMMRIKQSDFSPTNTTPVVGIMKYNFAGDPMDTVIIRVNNFRDENFNYNGQYIDKYIFEAPNDSLQFSGDPNSTGLNNGWHGPSVPVNEDCAVDFRIYWYGNVDVWFDKLTVDNDTANNLFNHKYDDDIKEEVQKFWPGPDSSNYFFFVDEIMYSRIEPLKYVYDSARVWQPGVKISCAITNYFDRTTLRTETPLTMKLYLEAVEPEVFTVDAHQLSDWNTLPESVPKQFGSSPYPHSSWFKSYSMYNNYIQKKVLGDKSEETGRTPSSSYHTYVNYLPTPEGSLVYQVRKARDYADLYSPNSKVIIQPQLQSWVLAIEGDDEYGQLSPSREPLNEEIQAQAVIALCHGADGLCWFIYDSFSFPHGSAGDTKGFPREIPSPAPDTTDFHYGLGELYSNTLRTYNAYGQEKPAYIAAFNQKLNNWKPYLDRIDWYDGVSVHKQTANHYFIEDIISIAPYISGTNPCFEDSPPSIYMDCLDERYWEIGFFSPKETTENAKYFTVLNRRCEPEYIESSQQKGDARVLKIKFDQSSLGRYRNWRLTDVNTGISIIFDAVNQGSNGYLSLGDTDAELGWFKPGEGKLFKLSPVIFGGGTLVADEVISDDEFISDTVFTDGYDLTIEDGNTITFDTNAVIMMDGGNFICGDVSGSGVDLSGTGEWQGIKLNGCDTVKIYKTNIEDIKDSSYAIDMYNCKQIELKHNTFDLDNSGAVRGSYVFSLGFFTPAIVLYDNSVDIGANTMPVFSFNANSASSFPVVIDNCEFNAPSTSSSSAINITNITGGVIKNNDITGYNTSERRKCRIGK